MTDLSHITEDLRPLAVPIKDVVKDPDNLRVHGDQSIEAIRGSLAKFTQRKPIVVNRKTKVIEAGNGTLTALVANGKEHVAVVWVDDDPVTATAYAIADNRTAELSAWDAPALKLAVDSLGDFEVPGIDAGFLDSLVAVEPVPPEPEEQQEDTSPKLGDLTFRIMVECSDEFEQADLLERFEKEGIKCQALMS